MSPSNTSSADTFDNSVEPVVLINADLDQPKLFSFVGGSAAAFTRRCPTKITSNEDSLAALPLSNDSGVLVVADGVGGERCGDRASETTIKTLWKALREGETERQDLRPAILDGIERANQEVMNLGVGAASTLAVVEVCGSFIRPYHVGDSMILLVGQRGRVKWQTVPHSPVGYAVEAGVLDESDALHHADRHLVSNIVGTEGMRIEIGPRLTMAKRDTLVVASDGLFDNLQIGEIIEFVRKGKLAKAIGQLVELVGQRMSQRTVEISESDSLPPSKPDDTSVLLLRRG